MPESSYSAMGGRDTRWTPDDEAASRNADMMIRLQLAKMQADAQERMSRGTNETALSAQRLANEGQLGVAGMQAGTQRYAADRGFDATKYQADTGLTGLRDTNATRLAGAELENRGRAEIARIGNEPQMGALDLVRQQYEDQGWQRDLERAKSEPERLTAQMKAGLIRDFMAKPQAMPDLSGRIANSIFGEDPAEADKRAFQRVATQQALQTYYNPEADAGSRKAAAQQLAQSGMSLPEPTAGGLDQRALNEQAKVDALIEPELKEIKKFIEANNWRLGATDRDARVRRAEAAIDNVRNLGASPAMVDRVRAKIKQEIEAALAGNGLFFEAIGSDAMRKRAGNL
jgi:hypothetical protein